MLFAGGGKNLPGADPTVATLTLDDAKAVETQVRGVKSICPQVMRPMVPASYRDRSYEVTVIGAGTAWQDGLGLVHHIRGFLRRAGLCGYGPRGRHRTGQWFASSFKGPIRSARRSGLPNANFKVKGVLPAKGTSPMGTDMDERVIIPLTTAMRRTFNVSTFTMVRVRVSAVGDVQRVASEVRALIRERHNIRPPDLDDFRVVTPDIIAGLSQMVAGTLNRVLLAVYDFVASHRRYRC